MLSPTRELAAQTEKNVLAIGEFLRVNAYCCIGGKSIGERPLLLGRPRPPSGLTHTKF